MIYYNIKIDRFSFKIIIKYELIPIFIYIFKFILYISFNYL